MVQLAGSTGAVADPNQHLQSMEIKVNSVVYGDLVDIQEQHSGISEKEINELEADGKNENITRFLRNLRWMILQISPVY